MQQHTVAQDFDQVAESYEREINDALAFSGMEHQFFIDVKARLLVEFAKAHFDRNLGELSALDLGCGLGAYHPGLNGVFGDLHGIDVSTQSVAIAAERHPFVQYTSYEGGALPYEHNRFDIVFTICVMHHVPPSNWEEFTAEMYRVLRPGGLVIVFEHNPYNPAVQYIVRSCPIDKDAVLLRPGKLRALFTGASFEDVRTRTILSVPPIGGPLTALDRALGHLPFGAQYSLRATKQKA